ncbi:hypothetical protein [Chryseobacterium rhizosphaerae]|uniref:hypothetical protein n=1 Tax=Chryseobacterium rhizosphaerae TaxID=395937 RepID=UPI003D0B98C3
MKYLRFIILFIIFIGVVIFLTRTGTKEYTQKNKLLKNGITIEGVVTGIKRSHNHGFGILAINVTESNVTEFSSQLSDGIYPYKVKGKYAEIYLPIFIQREIGDHIKLISDKEIIYYDGKKSKDEGEVYIITNSEDIDFVKENSSFK